MEGNQNAQRSQDFDIYQNAFNFCDEMKTEAHLSNDCDSLPPKLGDCNKEKNISDHKHNKSLPCRVVDGSNLSNFDSYDSSENTLYSLECDNIIQQSVNTPHTPENSNVLDTSEDVSSGTKPYQADPHSISSSHSSKSSENDNFKDHSSSEYMCSDQSESWLETSGENGLKLQKVAVSASTNAPLTSDISCVTCGKAFCSNKSLFRHCLIHTGEKPFKCEICDKCFGRKSTLKGHYLIHTKSREPYVCKICYRPFSDKDALENHVSGHSKENKCEICHKVFKKRQSLRYHYQIHREKPYICEICNKVYDHPSQHNCSFSGKTIIYKCKMCGTAFLKERYLKRHYVLHRMEKTYVCDICGKKFKQKHSLVRHYLVHTGEKPFQCEVCTKHYADKQSLMLHLTRHTITKPYVCDICQIGFNQKESLETHYLIHTSGKTYTCEVCNRHFRKSAALVQHCRIHTGEKPFRCELCSKSFSQKGTLQKHYKTHKERYSCDVCEKEFALKTSLTKHFRLHSDEQPYECDKCKKFFCQKVSLERHHIIHEEKS